MWKFKNLFSHRYNGIKIIRCLIYHFITFIYRDYMRYSLCIIKVMQIWYFSSAASRYKKGIAKIYTTVLISKTYFQFLVLFFVFFCRCMWFLSSTLKLFSFKDQTNKVEPTSPILSYSQMYEFRVFREIRFLYERTNSRCQQDQKDTISSSKLAESLQANETTAVHLDAAQPFWKSYPPFSLLSSSHLPPQQHGFSLSNRRYILWRTSRSKPSEFRLRR